MWSVKSGPVHPQVRIWYEILDISASLSAYLSASSVRISVPPWSLSSTSLVAEYSVLITSLIFSPVLQAQALSKRRLIVTISLPSGEKEMVPWSLDQFTLSPVLQAQALSKRRLIVTISLPSGEKEMVPWSLDQFTLSPVLQAQALSKRRLIVPSHPPSF